MSGRIETAAAPGLSISVTGPAPTAEDAASPSTGRRATIATLAIALVLTILVGRRTIPAIRHRLSEQRKRRRRSEAFAFAQFRGALRSGDPMAAHVSLSSWLERLQPGLGPRRFAEHYGDSQLLNQTEQLSRTVFAGDAPGADLRHLGQSMVNARRRYLQSRQTPSRTALPRLNP